MSAYQYRGEPQHALMEWGLCSPIPLIVKLNNCTLYVCSSPTEFWLLLKNTGCYYRYLRPQYGELWEDLIATCDLTTLWAYGVVPLQLAVPELEERIAAWASRIDPFRGPKGPSGALPLYRKNYYSEKDAWGVEKRHEPAEQGEEVRWELVAAVNTETMADVVLGCMTGEQPHAELIAARSTNRRLHRRCQEAESKLLLLQRQLNGATNKLLEVSRVLARHLANFHLGMNQLDAICKRKAATPAATSKASTGWFGWFRSR